MGETGVGFTRDANLLITQEVRKRGSAQAKKAAGARREETAVTVILWTLPAGEAIGGQGGRTDGKQ